jgi:Flp pilus assembly protein TadG
LVAPARSRHADGATGYGEQQEGLETMTTNYHASGKRFDDRGVSILIIAVSMIFVLGMAGLGIDLASLYVGRSQAQRAADAGALAAAKALANDNACVNGGGGSLSAACQTVARQQAEAVGNQNLIAGVNPNIGDADVTFISTSSGDPQIQVIAARDTAHNNPMPTFFVKIFGINSADVSAKAVAEAYTSTNGTGPPVGARCVKPWLIPNCDENNGDPNQQNPNCGTAPGDHGYFVIPQSGGLSSTLARNGPSPTGPIGEPFTLKPGDPGGAAAPGQYYAAFIPNTTTAPTECPACASSSGGGGSTNSTGSAAVYRANIECCNQTALVCGDNPNVTLASTAGNMVGPTRQGVDCLIHQSGNTFSSNCGQDVLNGNSSPCSNAPPGIMATPFSVTAGANNPYADYPGQSLPTMDSDSVVALPIWDGTPLTSGQNSNIRIVGFLQLFIQNEDSSNQGSVYGTIMNVTSCGGGGSGSGGGTGPIVAPGGSTIPIRLIHD